MRPQERAPDYRVVAGWSAFLVLIGAGAFVLGMVIHNETLAALRPPHPEPIYYCATGEDMPEVEPCRDERLGDRDHYQRCHCGYRHCTRMARRAEWDAMIAASANSTASRQH